ncbi:MAG: hypothetical protein AAGB22_05200 [Bacteroidota bacterium]
MPAQASFWDLIDSTVNKIDDGFSKDMDNGLMLSPEGSSDRLISFYENIEAKSPAWFITLHTEGDRKGLSFNEPGKDGSDESRLFLQEGGNVGIGTTQPEFELDVNGLVGMHGRVGTLATQSEVPADQGWQDIMSGLCGSNGFEVMAYVGEKGTRNYCLIHAIAVATFGNGKNSIRITRAEYSHWPWNGARLKLQWLAKKKKGKKQPKDYALQVRTRKNQSEGTVINFTVMRIWGDDMSTPLPPPTKVISTSTETTGTSVVTEQTVNADGQPEGDPKVTRTKTTTEVQTTKKQNSGKQDGQRKITSTTQNTRKKQVRKTDTDSGSTGSDSTSGSSSTT